MIVRFWGTRGSHPCPGPTTLRYGGNTSCVEVRSSSGTLIVLDCGTGACALGRTLAEEFGDQPVQGNLLISHTHWDHIQGFPFFASLFNPVNAWNVFGPRGLGQSLEGTLTGQMQYEYFPISIDQLGAKKEFCELTEGHFQIGDVDITTRFVNHPALTLGYRLRVDGVTVVYVPDHEPHHRALADGIGRLRGEDLRHAQFVRDADLLIHDCQYTAEEYRERVGWGHSTLEYVVDLAAESNVKQLALFHHDPERDDDAVDRLVAAAQIRILQRDTQSSLEIFGATEGKELAFQPVAATAGPSTERSKKNAQVNQIVIAATRNEAMLASLHEASQQAGCGFLNISSATDVFSAAKNQKPSVILVDTKLSEVCDHIDDLKDLAANVSIVLVRDRSQGIWCANEVQGSAADGINWPCSSAYLRSRIAAWAIRSDCRWRAAPIPSNEDDRLAALNRLAILDTGKDERFDRLTRLACRVLNTPMAAISLIDKERLWYKSISGFNIRETSREESFCAYTIQSEESFVVADALLDDRFADSPIVQERRNRFYAGVPLRADNQSVGSFCVMDTKPREISNEMRQVLRDLASLAQEQLDCMRAADSPNNSSNQDPVTLQAI